MTPRRSGRQVAWGPAARRLLALALAATGIAGCAPAHREPDAPAFAGRPAADRMLGRPVQPDPQAPPLDPRLAGTRATLTVWLAADYAGAPLFRDLDTAFERAYPGVHVHLLGTPWEAMPTKVKTAVVGGTPPDIAHHHSAGLGAQGFAEPLDDLWARVPDLERGLLPGTIEEVTSRGHRWGVPLDTNCALLVYNKALFDRAHVSYPDAGTTFAQLETDFAAFQRVGITGIGLTANPWMGFGFLLANGGDLLGTAGGREHATLDSPQNVQTLAMVRRWAFERHWAPVPTTKDRDYDDNFRLFTMGKLAMYPTGPWDFPAIAHDAPHLDFGVAPFPLGWDGRRHAVVQGGGSLFVPRGAAHRQLAFEWMRWATSPRYARRMLHELGRHPVARALYDDPLYSRDPHLREFARALREARPYHLDAYPQAEQAFADAVKACYYGADPVVTLHHAQAQAQWAIDVAEGQ